MSTSQSLQLRPLTGALGVEVFGVSLSTLTRTDLDEIRTLLDVYGVAVFPGQNLSAHEHVAFARNLGQPQIHAYHAAGGPYPELLIMRSDTALADFWHADETYEDRPPDIAVLRIVECPPVGGDTLWINQYLAFESLSSSLQELITPLRAVHTTPDKDASAIHPLVFVNPNTGRRALYVNKQFTRCIVGFNSDESKALLDVLFNTANNPDFQCRYRWNAGEVALWDNRTTLHRVAADYHELRHSERIAVLDCRSKWRI